MSRDRYLLYVADMLIVLWAFPAAAQGICFQGGGTANPDQFFVGSHIELVLGSDNFLIRPNVEGGTGAGLTAASVNFEFLYRYTFPGSIWAIYQGTGPAVNLYRFDDMTDVQGGLNFVFGVRHESGFFSEIKVAAQEVRTSNTASGSRSRRRNRLLDPVLSWL